MPSFLRSPWLRHLPLIFLVLFVAACPKAAGDGDAVRALVGREVEAFNQEDLKALSGIWSQDKDIVLFDVEPPGRFQGWDAIGRLYKNFFERVTEIHLTAGELRVTVDGSMAWASYDWAMTGRMGDYALDDRGQTTSIYRNGKEGWRLVHEHASSLPAMTPAPAASPTPGASK